MHTILASYFDFPPGTNNAYGLTNRTGKATSYIRKSGTDFKGSVTAVIKELNPDWTIPKRTPLRATYLFYVDISYINKFDIDGHIKLLQDAIFKCGGGNDAWIYSMVVAKHVHMKDEPDRSHVTLEVL